MSPAVRFQITAPPPRARVQVAIRLVLLLALGSLGCSSLYWMLYLALPAVAALWIGSSGPDGYLRERGPRVVRALGRVARAYAYLWLLTDEDPLTPEGREVDFAVELRGAPTPRSALLRLVYSLPALIGLALLSLVGACAWIVGAIAILLRGHAPHAITEFLAGTLRYQFGLLAYHLSLVDAYPSFAAAPAHDLSDPGLAARS